jgi:preprotein translocase subunit SecG
MDQQYERNTIFRIDNLIFLIFSIVLSIIFSYLNTQDQSDDNNQSSTSEIYFSIK